MEMGISAVSDWKLSEGKDDKAEKGKSNWRKGRGKDKERGRRGKTENKVKCHRRLESEGRGLKVSM